MCIRDRRVPVKKRTAGGEVGKVFGVPEVAMGGEQHPAPIVDELGIVGHAGEFEHHLIDLGFAIAAHGNDAVLSLIHI